MKTIIIIPVLVAVLLAGAVAYILFAPDTFPKPIYIRVNEQGASAASAGSNSTPEAAAAAPPTLPAPARPEAGSAALPLEPTWGIMYSLESKTVNLAEPGGLRYLQATVVLEFRPPVADYHQLLAEEHEHPVQ
jgi:flagellar basal body-associated protein FliL